MINKLQELDILGDVRQRLGAKSDEDSSKDEKIKNMSIEQVICAWCGWNLGDESWARDILHFYKELSKDNEDIK